MSLVHGKQQLLDRIKTKKNFNIAKSIPSSLLLSLIIMLFLCNWFWGKTNGYDFYRIKLLIAILGVATIVLLALSERWNTAAGNDRDSRIPDEGDRFFSSRQICCASLVLTVVSNALTQQPKKSSAILQQKWLANYLLNLCIQTIAKLL